MTTWSSAAFVAGHVSLDFLNTAGGPSKDRNVERLDRFTNAVQWARTAGLLDDSETDELVDLSDANPSAATRALEELHTQREALHAFLLAALEARRPQPAVRRRVESDLTTAYLAAHLSDRLEDAEAWTVRVADERLRLIGRRLALATGTLLAGGDRQHIRICDRCSWMFLDRSPTKRRRWCSMATCGNRAKALRHYRRSAPDDTSATPRH